MKASSGILGDLVIEAIYVNDGKLIHGLLPMMSSPAPFQLDVSKRYPSSVVDRE
jgi:hypothetical protein